MSELLTKISAKYVKPAYTEVKVGDTVRVYTTIKEGEKTRSQYFEGLVIRRRGGIGPSATFTVRRIASGVGVERTFPLHSPVIESIKVSRGAKTRRATLYTMRGLTGKAARLTEVPVKQATDRDVAKHPWVEKYGVKHEVAEVSEEEAAKEAAKEAQAQAAVEEAEAELAEEQSDESAAGEKTEKAAKAEAKDAPPKESKAKDAVKEQKDDKAKQGEKAEADQPAKDKKADAPGDKDKA